MTAPASYIPWSGTCPDCAKRCYLDRRTARRVARATRQGRNRRPGRLYAYACPTGHGWHVGHVPTAIRRGATARADYTPRSTP